jgi:hypothetical protein
MKMQPNRPGHADTDSPVAGAPGFTVYRRLVGYAYPQNGNVHNPTPRYVFELRLDGRMVDHAPRRGTLTAEARKPGARERYSA